MAKDIYQNAPKPKSSEAGKASLAKATVPKKKKKKSLAERAGRAALRTKSSDKRPLNTAGKIGRAGKNVAKMLIGGFPG